MAEELIKFKYRLAYGANDFLIEFISGVDENFGNKLFEAIKVLHPKIAGKDDVWMNDEVIYTVDSDLGRFTLSNDVWGFAFIVAEENQNCVAKINLLLLEDKRFEKIEDGA
jgi:hypothetical protein